MNQSRLIQLVALTASILACTSLFTPKDTYSQVTRDTVWGTGTFRTKDVNNAPVYGALISCTPTQIPGDTIHDNFTMEFCEPTGSFVPFELPVFIDLYTGFDEQKISNTAEVFPNPASDFTFAFHGDAKSDLRIYDLSGKLVKEVDVNHDASRNISGAYVDMSNTSAGTYVYQVATEYGTLSGKIVNNNSFPVGELSSSHNSLDDMFKNTNSNAFYDVVVTAENYDDYIENIAVYEEDNGLITFILNPTAGIPQYQYVGGFVYGEDLTGLEGAIVRIIDENNQLVEEMTTNSSGKYLSSQPLPAGTDFSFEVGGFSNRYAYVGDEASVPDEITQEQDTATNKYRWIAYKKSRQVPNTGLFCTPPSEHIRIMIGHGQIEGALRDIKYWPGNSITPSHEQGIDNNYVQLEQDVGLPGMWVKSSTELNQDINGYDPYTNPKPVGINIEQGTNNTNPDQIGVTNPLGNYCTPTFSAEMTLVDASYLAFAHENGRAFGLNGVSWASIMDAYASVFTNEDKVIWKLAATHAENVYDLGKAYFFFENIAEELPERSTK